jgi:uncharacterized protein
LFGHNPLLLYKFGTAIGYNSYLVEACIDQKPDDAPATSSEEHEAPRTISIVVKAHALCQFGCPECYVYEQGDTTWQREPSVMAQDTYEVLAERFTEYHEQYPDTKLDVTLHGGEPMLTGPRRMESALRTLQAAVPAGSISFGMQTNAALVNERWIELLNAYDVDVGVSLDGYRQANDRSRPYKSGRSTYDDTIRGIELLRANDRLSGLLGVISLDNDPIKVYETLAQFDPPDIDLLLPHHTWDNPPPSHGTTAPYGRWLIEVFEHWSRQPTPRPGIRTMDSIISMLTGGPSYVESIGISPVDLLVVRTNADIEQVDTLAAAFDGAAATPLNLREHSLVEALDYPSIKARRLGRDALRASLPEVCRGSDTTPACPVLEVCGGGYLPHRYSQERGFDNRSVYCLDLALLISHIAGALRQDTIFRQVRGHIASHVRNTISVDQGTSEAF